MVLHGIIVCEFLHMFILIIFLLAGVMAGRGRGGSWKVGWEGGAGRVERGGRGDLIPKNQGNKPNVNANTKT